MSQRESFDILYAPLAAQAYGGAERSLMDLATRFAAHGNRVGILLGHELAGTAFVDEARSRGLELRPVDWDFRRSKAYNIAAAARAFRQFEARIVHFNISWHAHMWAVAACGRLAGRPALIGSMRAMPDPHHLTPRRKYLGFIPGLQLWHLQELVQGICWGRVLDRTITVNAQDFKHRLVKDYFYPADKIGVVYNGVDTSRPAPGPQERAELRQRLGVSEGEILLVFVGRVSKEKGIGLLIEALARLPARVRLVVLGDGPQRQALEAQAAPLGARVRFEGEVLDPRPWMGAADAVAVPSTWYEAFGRVVVEAMREGTPVVASRIGGMAELFDDGVQGHYAQAGDAGELEAAIRKLMSLPEADMARMRRAARDLAVARYSLERVEAEYGAEYQRLCGGAIACAAHPAA